MIDTKISYFESTKKIEVKGEITIGELLNRIRDGEYKDQIEKLRNGDRGIKTQLPTFAVHGIFKHYRKKENFIEASGIIILDIDDVEDNLEEVKEDIMDSSNHVLSCMISPSGNGIKVLYYIDPDTINTDSYRLIGRELVSNFEIYGKVDFLSITDCLIATYDPNVLINEDVTPDRILVREFEKPTGELEERDESKVLWDDPEDFFDTVLYENIAEKTNNNFHFLQVAILDLKKFGFEHPKEDLSFVIDYAETTFKKSSQNKQRFLDIVELAKDYPQLRWAYKLNSNDEEISDPVDLSKYKESQDIENEGNEGLVDYSNLWDKCLETLEEGEYVGHEISLKNFAKHFRFKGSGILTVTGIPGHGKTEFVDAVLLDLARLYNHQSFIIGFEQSPQEHIVKLMRKMIGVDIRCETYRNNPDNIDIIRDNYNFITDHFKHIDVTKLGGNIDVLIENLASNIQKERAKGRDCKYVVLDPFNMLSIKGKLTNHEKIEEILRRLTHFSHEMNVLVVLVAHPFKMKKDEKTGEYEVPDFYSVKGSSAFFEMSYHGLVVYRMGNRVMVKVLKVKQNNLGDREAEVFFTYEKLPGRYIPIDEELNELSGDHREKNWLNKVNFKK